MAYAIYYDEELAFSKVGLASPDEPTIAIKNPGGEIALWVEVGTPSAERIHRASKASTKMALVVHLEPKPWLAILAGQKIHQREEIETIALDPKFLDQVASHFGDRGTALEVTITDDVLYVGIEKKNYQTTLERIAL